MIISDLQHCELAADVQELNNVEGGSLFLVGTSFTGYHKSQVVGTYFAGGHKESIVKMASFPGLSMLEVEEYMEYVAI